MTPSYRIGRDTGKPRISRLLKRILDQASHGPHANLALWGELGKISERSVGEVNLEQVLSETPRETVAQVVVKDGTLACVESDRFCNRCGYNLRTLSIHRDNHTKILLVRCTECGQYQPANDLATVTRPWLHRMSAFFLILWIVFLVAMYVHLGIAQGAVMYGTLEELTGWAAADTFAQPPGVQTIVVDGRVVYDGRVLIRNEKTMLHAVQEDFPHYTLFVSVMIVLSFVIGLLVSGGATAVLPHWRRIGYIVLIPIMPLAAGAIITLAWREEAPHLLSWGVPYVAAYAGVHMLGGMIGVFLGRPALRLIVRIMLPPSVQPRLAYLWLADDMKPPKPFRDQPTATATPADAADR